MWQLTGSGDGPYEIQENHKRVALITHTNLEAVRKMATAEKMLKALEWLLHLSHGVSASGEGGAVSNDEWESAFEFAQEVFTAAAKGEQ